MHHATRRMLLVACLALLAACASSNREDLVAAERAYTADQFSDAYELALRAGRSSDPEVADLAAYFAGLSAYRMGRLDDAERRLREAARSRDRTVAGRAHAQLGTIQLERKRPREAAESFRLAAEQLDGDDAARARYQAGVALRQAGDATGSRSQMLMAADTGGAVATEARRQLESTGWTLQGGCFRDRANADREAQRLAPLTTARGLGAPRVVPQPDSGGGTVYCVFIGEFATRQGAEQAKAKLGRKEFFARTIG